MIGLMKKEWLLLKETMWYYVCLSLLFGIVGTVGKNPSMFLGICGMLPLIVAMNGFQYEEKANWDKFALCAPVSRGRIVLSKYLLPVIILLCYLPVSVIVHMAAGLSALEIFYNHLIVTGIGLFFLGVMLPVVFKLGIIKGRMMLYGIILVPSALVFLLRVIPGVPQDWMPSLQSMSVIIFTVGLAALIISLFVSKGIYSKREF